MIKEVIKRPLRLIKEHILDERARFYLKKNADKKHPKEQPIKVGFIVFEPESWDKLQPVFEEMQQESEFAPYLIVVPSFDNGLRLDKSYGYEKEYFSSIYRDVLYAYTDNGCLINLKSLNLDFVFYQDPYDIHYPSKIRADKVVKYSRVCYIPYGYTISDNFSELLENNRAFFRNVFAFFADNKSDFSVMTKLLKFTYSKGIQRVVELGYPALDEYRQIKKKNDGNIVITWTPRWSYDKKVGGSHFLEYRFDFIELKNKFKDVSLVLRPHPMLFANMIKTNKMTKREVEEYKELLEKQNIEIVDKCSIMDVLKKTDILISDISSVIPSYFMTGNPIIYCKSELPVNCEFKQLLDGMYIADSWKDVLRYVSDILEGNDYLKEKRFEIINRGEMSIHIDSSKKIAGYIAKTVQ